TGTDEHGQKVADAAARAGKTPQEWCDELVPRWQALFAAYDVEYDDFIRTTQPRHERVVQSAFERMRANGDVYLGTYEGWYCVSDETFWPESKLRDGRCPTCGRDVTRISEEDWFFRLSKYRDRLIAYFREHPDWVRPRSAYNEMLALLEEGLDDLSITRKNLAWGIPVPGGADDGVIYVWFDALLNYISAIGWSTDDEMFSTFWPASVQLVGKEIARFHTLIWPAILWSLGEEAPDLVFAHGWITVDGQKMGKSAGNATDPFALVDAFGADSLRYFLLREAPFGSDFSYSEDKIAQRHNSDLGNDLGNLLHRTASMVQKYREGVVPARPDVPNGWRERFAGLPDTFSEHVFSLRFREALEAAWELVTSLNRAIDDGKPWAMFKQGQNEALDTLLFDLWDGLRRLAILLHPFMPSKMEEMWTRLGASGRVDGEWSALQNWNSEGGARIATGAPLFPRIELDKAEDAAAS
ncbi:MAG TPA: methionine--tRNA ligase, partial [Candidatus Tumulicola sp.]